MPLTASDIIARRKGLVLAYDAYNNTNKPNPQAFTTYTETYDALATGQQIEVSQQPTGSYLCSINPTTFQQMCASGGRQPTLSEVVYATNIQSVLEQAPAAGLFVKQISGGGIAVYCPNGTLLGAVNAAGQPIPYSDATNTVVLKMIRDGPSSSKIINFEFILKSANA